MKPPVAPGFGGSEWLTPRTDSSENFHVPLTSPGLDGCNMVPRFPDPQACTHVHQAFQQGEIP